MELKSINKGTPDLTEENIQKLGELFPQVLTEVQGDDGETLRDLLGDGRKYYNVRETESQSKSLKKMNLFIESLPKKCLYCECGQPILFGVDGVDDGFLCNRHCVEGLTSKKLTLRLTDMEVGRENRKNSPLYCPLVGAWESCNDFKPIKVGGRKFELLDFLGYFDDMKEDN